MSSYAKLGQYSTIKWNGTQIKDTKKIGSIPMENGEVEVTDLDSVAKEFIASMKDYGTLSIEGNYVPLDPGQAGLEADSATGIVREVVIYLASLSKTITFNAFVKSFKFGESTPEGVIPYTADLRITGTIASTKADLTALAISVGTLSPVFNATTYNYNVVQAFAVNTFTITPTKAGGTITITANGVTQTVASGVASTAVSISVGAVTQIVIGITSGTGHSTYTINASKLAV